MQFYKYMSALSLFDMILNSRLYFHPIHMFEDQWEGVPVPREEGALREYVERMKARNDLLGSLPVEMLHVGRFTSWASCWHEAERESVAMWKIYAGTGQGCCIIADRAKTIELLTVNPEMQHFSVKYVDRDSHSGLSVPFPPLHHSAQYKDLAYDYEREYRFLLQSKLTLKRTVLPDKSIWTQPDIEVSRLKTGTYVPFDLERVVERIVISPFLKPHEREVIAKVASRLFASTVTVETSSLSVR
jgi:Protein of unknown function (DUF2971)